MKISKPLLIGGVVGLLLAVAFYFVSNQLRPPELHGIVMQSPNPAPNFTLMGADGQEVDLRDFRGKFVMLYFGYTFCPDVCPSTLNDVRKAVEQLGDEAEDLQVVMVSVDPNRDTPEMVDAYVKKFNPTFVGLTGSTEQVLAAATPLGIFYEAHIDEGDNYPVDHTASIIGIDADGYVRYIFPYGITSEEMASDLAYLLR